MTWEEIVKVKFQGPARDPSGYKQSPYYRIGAFHSIMRDALENMKNLVKEHPDIKNNYHIKDTITLLERGLKMQDEIDRYDTYNRKDYPEKYFKR